MLILRMHSRLQVRLHVVKGHPNQMYHNNNVSTGKVFSIKLIIL